MSYPDYIEKKVPFSPETRHDIGFKRRSEPNTINPIGTGKVRVTVEGYVPSEGRIIINTFTIDATHSEIGNNTRYLARLLHDQMQAPGVPEWMAGDVVLHYFNDSEGSQPYTYVIESVVPWKTSGTRQLSEHALATGWKYHRTARVMRQGRPVEMGPGYCTQGENCDIDHTTPHE